MTAQNRTTLKGYFNTGDTPTEAQFADTVDSFLLVNGDTDLPVADGGTGASDAAGARTNLGAAALAANVFTGTQDFNAQQVEGYAARAIGITRRARASVVAARLPCARNPTITARSRRWHNWQASQVVSLSWAGHTTMGRPCGVVLRVGVFIGTMQTTGPAFSFASASASPASSALRFTVKPHSFACRIHLMASGVFLCE